jgi:predicted nuclease with TOPRIM domain
MERAIREKRAAESELEKMTLRLPQETQRMNDIIEELSNKLRLTEKERIQSSELASR